MNLVLADILEELKRLNRTLERVAEVVVEGFVVVPLDLEEGEEQ